MEPNDFHSNLPINRNDEKLRSAMRVLFAKLYGNEVSQLKGQVAYRLLSPANDDKIADLLLQDLIRGSFAEAVLRNVLGDVLDTLLIYLRNGDVEKVRDLVASAAVDGDKLASVLGQDYRSIMTGNRIHIDRRHDRAPDATVDLVSNTGSGSVAETVERVFAVEGEAREAGLTYLSNLNSSDAVLPLLSIVDDPAASDENLLDSIALLAATRDERAVIPLTQLIQRYESPTVCGAAINALIAIRGTHIGAVSGMVAGWYAINEQLAQRVISMFGDVADNDDFLTVMLNRNQPDRMRLLAALALSMSRDVDYALPLLSYLNDESDEHNQRWRAVMRVEQTNTVPQITMLFASRLDDEVRKTAIQQPTAETIRLIERLMMAMVYLANDEAESALRGVKSNSRVDDRIQAVANKALERLHDRRKHDANK